MSEIWLIRHGQTPGNREKRYVGQTDESLSPEGAKALTDRKWPRPDLLFSSPLRRCRESAALLFPDLEPVLIDELRECDFGSFEMKNYQELCQDPDYQNWIDSGGQLPFPGGESREAFKKRSLYGFQIILDNVRVTATQKNRPVTCALVTHAGVIMNIMEDRKGPPGSFYDWMLENGGYYILSISDAPLPLLCTAD